MPCLISFAVESLSWLIEAHSPGKTSVRTRFACALRGPQLEIASRSVPSLTSETMYNSKTWMRLP